jgi:hypothetical protein
MSLLLRLKKLYSYSFGGVVLMVPSDRYVKFGFEVLILLQC